MQYTLTVLILIVIKNTNCNNNSKCNNHNNHDKNKNNNNNTRLRGSPLRLELQPRSGPHPGRSSGPCLEVLLRYYHYYHYYPYYPYYHYCYYCYYCLRFCCLTSKRHSISTEPLQKDQQERSSILTLYIAIAFCLFTKRDAGATARVWRWMALLGPGPFFDRSLLKPNAKLMQGSLVLE